MKKMRFLSCLLVFVIVAVSMIASVTPAHAATSGDYTYTDNGDGTCNLNSYTGAAETLAIPETLGGLAVTSIESQAIAGCSNLTSITLPGSLTSIADQAILNCSKLTEITIPSGVTSIGELPFYECRKLTGINVDAGNQNYASEGGILYNKDKSVLASCPHGLTSVTIPDSVTSIANSAFAECYELTSVTIPSSVTSIGDSAFVDDTKLTSITIPNSVTSIGAYAFAYCTELTGVTIPDSVTSIGADAFANCYEITSITIPSGITSIADGVFTGTGLTSVTIPSSVTSIGEGAFCYCENLTSVTIPDSVTSIGDWAFNTCSSLTSITIPDSVTVIGNYAFYNCTNMTSITIDAENQNYSSVDGVLYNKTKSDLIYCPAKLTSVTIPNSVTSIKDSAFALCPGLTSVTIPGSVTSIGSNAFWCCSSLTSVTIPNSVTSIGGSAFFGCTSLNTVYFDGIMPAVGNGVFSNCHSNLMFNCPDGNPGGITLSPVIHTLTKTINVSAINGTITPSTSSGMPGETISIVVAPATGYILRADSLKYNDGFDHKLNGSSFIMPDSDITISAVFMTVSVGSQNRSLTAGTAGSATFAATTANIADGGAVSVNWCNAGGSAVSAPAGLSASGTNITANSSTITVTAGTMAAPGTYYFKATSEGVASNVVTLTVQLPTLSSIAITTPATKLSYFVGEALDITGLVVTGTYHNGYTRAESLTAANVTGFDSTAPAASQTLTISVGGKADTYSIEIKAVPVTHTVTFKDWDGTTLKTQTVNDGEGATAPANPNRTGFTFTGWDRTFNSITSDLTVTAQYSANDSGNGGGSTPPSNAQKTETVITENMATATTTTTATADSSGKATASVTHAQVSDIVGKAVEEAAKRGNGVAAVAEIKVESSANAKTIETGLPKTAADALAKSNADALIVSTPIAAITFDKKALETIAGAAAADVKISASKVDAQTLDQETKQIVGDRPVFNFSVTSGDKTISQFNGNVTVSVPYTPRTGEDTSAIIIYYINAEGKAEIVSNCTYDPETGTVIFTTSHFSVYAVGYNKMSFNDVSENSWYGSAVSFIAARGITTGTGNGNFSPDAKLTRGEFLVMMMRAYGIPSDTDPADNFADAGSTYYTGYLAAAKRMGISGGVGNNMFAPEMKITRQEMFALLYNALKVIGRLPQGNSGKTLSDFTDAGQIDSWAKDAMTLLVETGTVGGSNGTLMPLSTSTRADMAQVLYNLLAK